MFYRMQDKRLLIIQPILVSYRKPFFNDLAEYFQKVVVYADLNPGEGFKSDVDGNFDTIHTPLIGDRKKVYYQKGIISSIFKNKPSVIFMTADFRALHFWLILVISKMLHIPIFSHGQGLYNKPVSSLLHKLMFKVTTVLSDSYVCYTHSVFNSLIAIGIKKEKLSVMDNTIVNSSIVRPEEKTNLEDRLFFIGRLREGCNLEFLFDVMDLLKKRGNPIGLDVIGDGLQREHLESVVDSLGIDVKFFGMIYDDKMISEISRNTSIGIYPGDAGLSLVHYMSLSLVPIVHNDLTKHMGPEPSYIRDGINGLLFKRNDKNSLAKTIENLLSDQSLIKQLSISAFDTYVTLSEPTMAQKLLNIIKNKVDNSNIQKQLSNNYNEVDRKRSMKISLVTNIPTPYRDTQFELIKKKYPELIVYFTGDHRENRLWNTSKNNFYIFLKKIISVGQFGQLNYGLFNIIKKSDILIIGGYEQPSYMVLALLAKLYGIPTILMFDGVAPSRVSSCKNNIKYLLKKFIISKFSVIWANGSVAYKYFKECFRVDGSKIFNQFLSVDSSIFDQKIDKKSEIKSFMRKKYAIDSKQKVLLYSGRFVERKKVLDLINALSIVKRSNCGIDIKLILIGDNDEIASDLYKNCCKTQAIDCMFLGFIQKEDLYKYYFFSDLLVLPSVDEPWGLVVNEAIYSQVPVVASSDVGSAFDLVEDGINGYIFEKGNIVDLSEKILSALNIRDEIVNQKCLAIRESWNLVSSVNQLDMAIDFILEQKRQIK